MRGLAWSEAETSTWLWDGMGSEEGWEVVVRGQGPAVGGMEDGLTVLHLAVVDQSQNLVSSTTQ